MLLSSLSRLIFISVVALAASAGGAQTRLDPANSFGTGFAVTANGHVLTSYHVVKGGKDIRVFMPERQTRALATLVGFDEKADFALLKIDAQTDPLKITQFSTVPIGIEIFSLGFPQPSIQGQSLKITSGIINSLEGWRGDKSSFQFSAPTQRGNSGGPILTADGGVVGLIQGKLGLATGQLVNKATDIPQNVNFASNSQRIAEFLSSHAVPFGTQSFRVDPVPRAHEVYAGAKNSVFSIEVVGTKAAGAQPDTALSMEVRLLLERLDPDDQARLLGAIQAGFQRVLITNKEVVMINRAVEESSIASQWARPLGLLKPSEVALGTILSFDGPKEHPNGFTYRSVVLAAGFDCDSERLRVVYREYKDQSFGGGKTQLKLLRSPNATEDGSRDLRSAALRSTLRAELCKRNAQ